MSPIKAILPQSPKPQPHVQIFDPYRTAATAGPAAEVTVETESTLVRTAGSRGPVLSSSGRHAPSHPADRRATAEAGGDTGGKARSPWDAIINEYLGGSSGSRRLTTPI